MRKKDGHRRIAGPRICFLDLESTGIEADIAMLTAVGLVEESGRFIFLPVKKPEEERRVIRDAIKLLEKYDIVFTWRGKDFDIPFLISRALKHRIDPTPLMRVMHVDLAEFARNVLKLSKNNLYTTSRFLGVRKDTTLEGADMPQKYLQSLTGKGGAWSSIRRHCYDDLKTLQAVYERLKPLLRVARPELAL
ncbi:MAG: ribonuclease H-like domain-containing protein [Aigarchaeota archaeon]|nr:ribonuclease H-like domain-containing protein [Candidatus Pelearchaeum maunauluense]